MLLFTSSVSVSDSLAISSLSRTSWGWGESRTTSSWRFTTPSAGSLKPGWATWCWACSASPCCSCCSSWSPVCPLRMTRPSQSAPGWPVTWCGPLPPVSTYCLCEQIEQNVPSVPSMFPFAFSSPECPGGGGGDPGGLLLGRLWPPGLHDHRRRAHGVAAIQAPSHLSRHSQRHRRVLWGDCEGTTALMNQDAEVEGPGAGQQVSSELLCWLLYFLQSFGEGLAVIPLMGLLESIAIARAFGECVHSEQQDASRMVDRLRRIIWNGLFAHTFPQCAI